MWVYGATEEIKKIRPVINSDYRPYSKMVPKARIELARSKITAPSRQRVYQFHHFGTQFYVFYSWAAGASGAAGAASSVASVGIGMTFSSVGSTTVVGAMGAGAGTLTAELITDPVLDTDEM